MTNSAAAPGALYRQIQWKFPKTLNTPISTITGKIEFKGAEITTYTFPDALARLVDLHRISSGSPALLDISRKISKSHAGRLFRIANSSLVIQYGGRGDQIALAAIHGILLIAERLNSCDGLDSLFTSLLLSLRNTDEQLNRELIIAWQSIDPPTRGAGGFKESAAFDVYTGEFFKFSPSILHSDFKEEVLSAKGWMSPSGGSLAFIKQKMGQYSVTHAQCVGMYQLEYASKVAVLGAAGGALGGLAISAPSAHPVVIGASAAAGAIGGFLAGLSTGVDLGEAMGNAYCAPDESVSAPTPNESPSAPTPNESPSAPSASPEDNFDYEDEDWPDNDEMAEEEGCWSPYHDIIRSPDPYVRFSVNIRREDIVSGLGLKSFILEKNGFNILMPDIIRPYSALSGAPNPKLTTKVNIKVRPFGRKLVRRLEPLRQRSGKLSTEPSAPMLGSLESELSKNYSMSDGMIPVMFLDPEDGVFYLDAPKDPIDVEMLAVDTDAKVPASKVMFPQGTLAAQRYPDGISFDPHEAKDMVKLKWILSLERLVNLPGLR